MKSKYVEKREDRTRCLAVAHSVVQCYSLVPQAGDVREKLGQNLRQQPQVPSNPLTQVTVLQFLDVSPKQPLGGVRPENVQVGLELLVLGQLLGSNTPGNTVVRHLPLEQVSQVQFIEYIN